MRTEGEEQPNCGGVAVPMEKRGCLGQGQQVNGRLMGHGQETRERGGEDNTIGVFDSDTGDPCRYLKEGAQEKEQVWRET